MFRNGPQSGVTMSRSRKQRHQVTPPDPPSAERRRALRTLARAVGAVAAGSTALAAAGCGAPIVDPDAVSRIPLAEVPPGRKMILHADRRVELRRSGDRITARLMVCTHEFCDLTWYEPEASYRCTCHNGRFSVDGTPRSGPVSKPMFELPVRIDGDQVVVGPAGELSLSG